MKSQVGSEWPERCIWQPNSLFINKSLDNLDIKVETASSISLFQLGLQTFPCADEENKVLMAQNDGERRNADSAAACKELFAEW